MDIGLDRNHSSTDSMLHQSDMVTRVDCLFWGAGAESQDLDILTGANATQHNSHRASVCSTPGAPPPSSRVGALVPTINMAALFGSQCWLQLRGKCTNQNGPPKLKGYQYRGRGVRRTPPPSFLGWGIQTTTTPITKNLACFRRD